MEIKIHTKDTLLSPRLEEYINKKLERLDRYLSNITDANLELLKEGRSEQPIVQLTIRNERGTIFRVEEKKQDDFFAAVDIVVDRMSRQLARYKDKRKRKGKKNWVEANDLPPIPEEEEEELFFEEVDEPVVVRRKEIFLNPMYEEEAVEQMELLGHDFFIYLDGDSGKVHVAYKRRDGNYGILIAET